VPADADMMLPSAARMYDLLLEGVYAAVGRKV
jgi:hypothetical protein